MRQQKNLQRKQFLTIFPPSHPQHPHVQLHWARNIKVILNKIKKGKYTFTAYGLGQTNITIYYHFTNQIKVHCIYINHWIEINLTFLVLPFRYFQEIV